MAVIDAKVKRVISECIKELKRNNIPIDNIILFGSHAKGTSKKFSDIDLLIVSPIFKGDRIEDKNKIRKYILKVSSEIEVIPCSREEFKKRTPFIEEILNHGIKIF